MATICKRYCVQGLKMHVHAMIDLGYLLWSICVYHILCMRRVFLSTNFHRPLGLSNDAALRKVIARTCSNTNRYIDFFLLMRRIFLWNSSFAYLKIYTRWSVGFFIYLSVTFFLAINMWFFFRHNSSRVINTSNSFRSFGIDCLISPDFFVNKRLFLGSWFYFLSFSVFFSLFC